MIIINVLLLYTSSRTSAVGLTEGCFFKHSCTNSTKQEDLKFTHKKDNLNFLAWYYRAAQIKRIYICPTRSTFSQSKQNILLDIHVHCSLYVDLNFFNYYVIPNLNCSLWFNTFNWHDTTHFDSEDDYCKGCRNVSHCKQQQSYSGLCCPGRSYSTFLWNDSWVQTFHSCSLKCLICLVIMSNHSRVS